MPTEVDNSNIVYDQSHTRIGEMADQLGRELTANEQLTVIDQVRKENGLSAHYSDPLPGVTAKFVAFMASFSSNVLQRVTPWKDNSLADAITRGGSSWLEGDGLGDVNGSGVDGGGTGFIDFNPNDTLQTTVSDAAAGLANAGSKVVDFGAGTAGSILASVLNALSLKTWLVIGGAVVVLYVYKRVA